MRSKTQQKRLITLRDRLVRTPDYAFNICGWSDSTVPVCNTTCCVLGEYVLGEATEEASEKIGIKVGLEVSFLDRGKDRVVYIDQEDYESASDKGSIHFNVPRDAFHQIICSEYYDYIEANLSINDHSERNKERQSRVKKVALERIQYLIDHKELTVNDSFEFVNEELKEPYN